MTRSILARRCAVALLGAVLAALAHAADAPPCAGAPVRLVVPFPPAGGTDVVARLIGAKIVEATGWNLVIDNRAGASGNLGLDVVAKARPDGCTIALAQTANLAINPALFPALFPALPFDALKDLVPLAVVASEPVVLVVRGEARWRSLGELVAGARARPGALTQALAGNGTVGHLAGELLARRAAMHVTYVPYKGAAPALSDLMGGQTDFMFATPQSVVALVKSGKLRALAVSSGQRIAILPEVPTVAESGYAGFDAVDWKMLVAPAGTPRQVVVAFNAAVNRALAQAETLARLLSDGSRPIGGTPEDAVALLHAEHARWGALVREAGVKLD